MVGRLHHEQSPGRQLAAEGSQDQAIRHPPARSWSSASEDEQLLAEDKEFKIAIGRRAGARAANQAAERRLLNGAAAGSAK